MPCYWAWLAWPPDNSHTRNSHTRKANSNCHCWDTPKVNKSTGSQNFNGIHCCSPLHIACIVPPRKQILSYYKSNSNISKVQVMITLKKLFNTWHVSKMVRMSVTSHLSVTTSINVCFEKIFNVTCMHAYRILFNFTCKSTLISELVITQQFMVGTSTSVWTLRKWVPEVYHYWE